MIDFMQQDKEMQAVLIKGIGEIFPIKGRNNTMSLQDLKIKTQYGPSDLNAQKDHKLRERTYSGDVIGTFVLKDENNKVIDRQTMKIMDIPVVTERGTYIINGTEYNVPYQLRIRSGVYSRVQDDGNLTAWVNLSRGSNFKIVLDDDNQKFYMLYQNNKIPLYPILTALGKTRGEIKKVWGAELTDINSSEKHEATVKKLYDKMGGEPTSDLTTMHAGIETVFNNTELDGNTTEKTIGKKFSKVDGSMLLVTSKKLLNIKKGNDVPDQRDSLRFKSVHGMGDFIGKRLQIQSRRIAQKILNRIDNKTKIKEMVSPSIFNGPINSFYHDGDVAIAGTPKQANPIDMISESQKITLTGSGGITNPEEVTEEARSVHPSSMGLIDPVHTPECHSADTEVLTYDGWKKWPDAKEDDLFACNIDGIIEYHNPEKIYAGSYNGKMFGAKTPRFEYLVTPNHRMWCRPPDDGSEYRFVNAEDLHGAYIRNVLSTHGAYLGEYKKSIDLPHVDSGNAGKNEDSVCVDDWAEFIGWYVSEGSFRHNEETSSYFVKISQNVDANPQNCQIIESLLERLPFSWCYSSNDFVLSTKQLSIYFSKFGKSEDKYIPEFIFGLHLSARQRCFDSMMLGDGKVDSYGGQQYSSCSRRLAEDFERLAISLGMSTRIKTYQDNREERYKDIHNVYIMKRKELCIRAKKGEYTISNYDGIVYCATVPGGLLYTRRGDGIGFWSGNSGKIGLTLHMPIGSSKKGDRLVTKAINARTGKQEQIGADEIETKTISFADNYNIINGKYVPRTKKVHVYSKDGKMRIEDSKNVDYIVRDGKLLFSIATNLIPFLQNTHPNRGMMGAKMISQALPLVNPDAPNVQTTVGGTSITKKLGNGFIALSKEHGVVKSIGDNEIVVKHGNNTEKYPYYNNFPLNDGHFFNDKVLVKAGDEVKKNQQLTENMFTEGGTLAYGKNLRVGYMAPKGLAFEDAIVISESAADMLTSQHMYKVSAEIDKSVMLGLNKFRLYAPNTLSAKNSSKLDEDGVMKKGEMVEPGDVVFAGLRKMIKTPDEEIIGKFSKNVKPYRKYTKLWEKDFIGKVTDVVKSPKEIRVYITTHERSRVGDKLSGAYGNKGVISEILPDSSMPTDKEGRSLEIIMNPLGIPSRINPSQLLETAGGKIADKTGKPYLIENFKDKNYLDKLKKDLKSAGLKDKDEMFNPETGKSLGKIMVGNQYIMKLDHNVAKKMSARGPLGEANYTEDLAPTSGKQKGGMSEDALTVYSLLSHGVKENLREMSSDKAEKNDEFWMALESGLPLPNQRPTFAWEKFTNILKSAGVNLKEDGNKIQLLPMTDKQTSLMSNGEVKKEDLIRSKNLVPMKGGLFDKEITGGVGGKNWSHIALSEPMLNPIFMTPVRVIMDYTSSDIDNIIAGRLYVDKMGKKVSKDTDGAQTGPKALNRSLKSVDVDAAIDKAKEDAKKAKGPNLNKANRKIRYLMNLQKLGEDASVFMVNKIPILPPMFRPIYPLPDGNLRTSHINIPYKDLITINNQLKEAKRIGLPDEQLQEAREELFDAYKGLVGVASPVTRKEFKGALEIVAGARPKTGFYQSKLISRRQELSGRSTVVPNPNLDMDELEIPQEIMWKLYKPFVKRRLKSQGYTLLQANEEIEKKTNTARKALEIETNDRPIMMNRAPSLHKFSIMSFHPKLSSKKAIGVNPFVVKGFNMDFDGDAVQLHVPVREGARKEAYKMLPSANLFSPRDNSLMHKPSMETIVGLNMLTRDGNKSNKKYSSERHALDAYKDKNIGLNDIITVSGEKTNIGRILLNNQLPKGMNISGAMTKKTMDSFLEEIAKDSPQNYSNVISKLRDVGNDYVYKSGFTIGLDDLTANYARRTKIFKDAEARLGKKPTDEDIINSYSKAAIEIDNMVDDLPPTNSFKLMMDSGSKGSVGQIRQVMAAPTLVQDLNEQAVPFPIKSSYAEGLNTAEYFATQDGARRTMMDRVLQTKWPGVLNKELVNATASQVISAIDCGTRNGITLDVGDSNVLDRYVAKDDSGTLRYNTLLDSNRRASLIKNKVKTINVRSPLTCEKTYGLCAKCFGLDETGELPNIGDNVGVKSAQTIAEPSTQLTMRSFHSGGTASANQSVSKGFFRIQDLLHLRSNLPDKATIATLGGVVRSITPSPTGGFIVFVGDERHVVSAKKDLLVKEGDNVNAGDPLSSGPIKPQDIAIYKGMRPAQDYVINELDRTFRDSGIKINRKMFETVARPMTTTARVLNPGSSDVAPGDHMNFNRIEEMNKTLGDKITYEPMMVGINSIPLYTEDWLSRLNSKELKNTIMEGAAKGFVSEISPLKNPIAAWAYGPEKTASIIDEMFPFSAVRIS